VCDHFAYADGFEDARYVGLVAAGGGATMIDPAGLIVKPEVAHEQLKTGRGGPTSEPPSGEWPLAPPPAPEPPVTPTLPRRFFGTVDINPDRAVRDMGQVAEEVLQHLTSFRGSKVRVTVEIEADVPEGVGEDVQRVINENCQTLRFKSHGFERS
jgi:hypothetical protein